MIMSVQGYRDRIDVENVNDYKPIRNDDDLTAAFRRLESIFQTDEKTPEADERDMLVTLVEAYESQHFDFDPPVAGTTP